MGKRWMTEEEHMQMCKAADLYSTINPGADVPPGLRAKLAAGCTAEEAVAKQAIKRIEEALGYLGTRYCSTMLLKPDWGWDSEAGTTDFITIPYSYDVLRGWSGQDPDPPGLQEPLGLDGLGLPMTWSSERDAEAAAERAWQAREARNEMELERQHLAETRLRKDE